MKTVFYKIDCLTNLHVGSGEVNYNIIDNEVEKDAVTDEEKMLNYGEQIVVIGISGGTDLIVKRKAR